MARRRRCLPYDAFAPTLFFRHQEPEKPLPTRHSSSRAHVAAGKRERAVEMDDERD
jgi:hypothetical protein